MATVKITKIECKTQNEDGGDEIFLMCDGVKVWGGEQGISISKGKEVQVDYEKSYQQTTNIELWEHDDGSRGKSDLLGQKQFEAFSIGSGSFPCNGDEAQYVVHYETSPL